MSITDFSDTVQAKSDQINAEDFAIGPKTFTITRTEKKKGGGGEWLMHIFFAELDVPYIPSKGYRKIIIQEMGYIGEEYTGQKLELDLDPSVKYSGKEVGGICIVGMSAIQKTTRHRIRLNSNQYKFVDIKPITIPVYTDQQFIEKLPAVLKAIQDGKFTIETAIAQLEKTAQLTDDQKVQITTSQKDIK